MKKFKTRTLDASTRTREEIVLDIGEAYVAKDAAKLFDAIDELALYQDMRIKELEKGGVQIKAAETDLLPAEISVIKQDVKTKKAEMPSNIALNSHDFWRVLLKEGYEIGYHAMFRLLKKHKIYNNKNIAYDKYVDEGYFCPKNLVQYREYRNGKKYYRNPMLITEKGQKLIANLVKEDMNSISYAV